MSKYICDMSNILAGVLQRAAEAQPAQFAGYWANIDFWFSEYEHVVHIAATYDMRYSVMKAAYDLYVAKHGGPHNRDDAGFPYQGITQSKRRNLKEAVSAVSEGMERVIERAQRFEMIDITESDVWFERVKLVRRGDGW